MQASKKHEEKIASKLSGLFKMSNNAESSPDSGELTTNPVCESHIFILVTVAASEDGLVPDGAAVTPAIAKRPSADNWQRENGMRVDPVAVTTEEEYPAQTA